MKTNNYQKFKFIATNRIIKESHVQKLSNSMNTHGFLNSKPITVNSNYEIIDGQHRFMAAKRLGIDVIYEIDNVDINECMVTVNTTSNTWRLNEFIEHYAKKGLVDFIELNKFINNTDYGVSNCISIFCGFSVTPKHIRTGVMPFKNLKFNESIELIEFFRNKLKFFKTNKFIESLIILVNRKDIDKKHIDKLKLNAYSIVECANNNQYANQYNSLLKLKIKNN
jgi:hypothetical protein